eukprot:g2542.t1
MKSDERWDKLVACVKKTHSKKYKSELIKSVTGGGEKTEIALKKKGEKIPTIIRTFNNAEIEEALNELEFIFNSTGCVNEKDAQQSMHIEPERLLFLWQQEGGMLNHPSFFNMHYFDGKGKFQKTSFLQDAQMDVLWKDEVVQSLGQLLSENSDLWKPSNGKLLVDIHGVKMTKRHISHEYKRGVFAMDVLDKLDWVQTIADKTMKVTMYLGLGGVSTIGHLAVIPSFYLLVMSLGVKEYNAILTGFGELQDLTRAIDNWIVVGANTNGDEYRSMEMAVGDTVETCARGKASEMIMRDSDGHRVSCGVPYWTHDVDFFDKTLLLLVHQAMKAVPINAKNPDGVKKALAIMEEALSSLWYTATLICDMFRRIAGIYVEAKRKVYTSHDSKKEKDSKTIKRAVRLLKSQLSPKAEEMMMYCIIFAKMWTTATWSTFGLEYLRNVPEGTPAPHETWLAFARKMALDKLFNTYLKDRLGIKSALEKSFGHFIYVEKRDASGGVENAYKDKSIWSIADAEREKFDASFAYAIKKESLLLRANMKPGCHENGKPYVVEQWDWIAPMGGSKDKALKVTKVDETQQTIVVKERRGGAPWTLTAKDLLDPGYVHVPDTLAASDDYNSPKQTLRCPVMLKGQDADSFEELRKNALSDLGDKPVDIRDSPLFTLEKGASNLMKMMYIDGLVKRFFSGLLGIIDYKPFLDPDNTPDTAEKYIRMGVQSTLDYVGLKDKTRLGKIPGMRDERESEILRMRETTREQARKAIFDACLPLFDNKICGDFKTSEDLDCIKAYKEKGGRRASLDLHEASKDLEETSLRDLAREKPKTDDNEEEEPSPALHVAGAQDKDLQFMNTFVRTLMNFDMHENLVHLNGAKSAYEQLQGGGNVDGLAGLVDTERAFVVTCDNMARMIKIWDLTLPSDYAKFIIFYRDTSINITFFDAIDSGWRYVPEYEDRMSMYGGSDEHIAGGQLLVGDKNGNAYVWNLRFEENNSHKNARGRTLATLFRTPSPRSCRHTRKVTFVAMAKSNVLVTASADRSVKVWNMQGCEATSGGRVESLLFNFPFDASICVGVRSFPRIRPEFWFGLENGTVVPFYLPFSKSRTTSRFAPLNAHFEGSCVTSDRLAPGTTSRLRNVRDAAARAAARRRMERMMRKQTEEEEAEDEEEDGGTGVVTRFDCLRNIQSMIDELRHEKHYSLPINALRWSVYLHRLVVGDSRRSPWRGVVRRVSETEARSCFRTLAKAIQHAVRRSTAKASAIQVEMLLQLYQYLCNPDQESLGTAVCPHLERDGERVVQNACRVVANAMRCFENEVGVQAEGCAALDCLLSFRRFCRGSLEQQKKQHRERRNKRVPHEEYPRRSRLQATEVSGMKEEDDVEKSDVSFVEKETTKDEEKGDVDKGVLCAVAIALKAHYCNNAKVRKFGTAILVVHFDKTSTLRESTRDYGTFDSVIERDVGGDGAKKAASVVVLCADKFKMDSLLARLIHNSDKLVADDNVEVFPFLNEALACVRKMYDKYASAVEIAEVLSKILASMLVLISRCRLIRIPYKTDGAAFSSVYYDEMLREISKMSFDLLVLYTRTTPPAAWHPTTTSARTTTAPPRSTTNSTNVSRVVTHNALIQEYLIRHIDEDAHIELPSQVKNGFNAHIELPSQVKQNGFKNEVLSKRLPCRIRYNVLICATYRAMAALNRDLIDGNRSLICACVNLLDAIFEKEKKIEGADSEVADNSHAARFPSFFFGVNDVTSIFLPPPYDKSKAARRMVDIIREFPTSFAVWRAAFRCFHHILDRFEAERRSKSATSPTDVDTWSNTVAPSVLTSEMADIVVRFLMQNREMQLRKRGTAGGKDRRNTPRTITIRRGSMQSRMLRIAPWFASESKAFEPYDVAEYAKSGISVLERITRDKETWTGKGIHKDNVSHVDHFKFLKCAILAVEKFPEEDDILRDACLVIARCCGRGLLSPSSWTADDIVAQYGGGGGSGRRKKKKKATNDVNISREEKEHLLQRTRACLLQITFHRCTTNASTLVAATMGAWKAFSEIKHNRTFTREGGYDSTTDDNNPNVGARISNTVLLIMCRAFEARKEERHEVKGGTFYFKFRDGGRKEITTTTSPSDDSTRSRSSKTKTLFSTKHVADKGIDRELVKRIFLDGLDFLRMISRGYPFEYFHKDMSSFASNEDDAGICIDLSGLCIDRLPPTFFVGLYEFLAPRQVHHLILSYNRLKRIPPSIGRLKELRTLDLSYNIKLHTIPPEIGQCEYLKQRRWPFPKGRRKLILNGIDVELKFPPKEICDSGGVRGIVDFYDSTEGDFGALTPCTDRRCLVVGTGSVGKTSLRVNLCNYPRVGFKTVNGHDRATVGIEVEDMISADKSTTISLWDFGGQEAYYQTHALFLTPRSIYLLVFDISTYECSAKYFECHLANWIEILDARIAAAGGSGLVMNLILVATKIDKIIGDGEKGTESLIEERIKDVVERLYALAERKEASAARAASAGKLLFSSSSSSCRWLPKTPKDVLRVSAHSGIGIRALREKIFEIAERYPVQMSKNWIRLRDELEIKHASGPLRTASTSQIADFVVKKKGRWKWKMKRTKIRRNVESALRLFHDLGKILWYEDIPELRDVLFCDPKCLVALLRALVRHDMHYHVEHRLVESGRLETCNVSSVLSNLRRGVMSRRLCGALWDEAGLANSNDVDSFVAVCKKLDLVVPFERGSGFFVPFYLGELTGLSEDGLYTLCGLDALHISYHVSAEKTKEGSKSGDVGSSPPSRRVEQTRAAEKTDKEATMMKMARSTDWRAWRNAFRLEDATTLDSFRAVVIWLRHANDHGSTLAFHATSRNSDMHAQHAMRRLTDDLEDILDEYPSTCLLRKNCRVRSMRWIGGGGGTRRAKGGDCDMPTLHLVTTAGGNTNDDDEGVIPPRPPHLLKALSSRPRKRQPEGVRMSSRILAMERAEQSAERPYALTMHRHNYATGKTRTVDILCRFDARGRNLVWWQPSQRTERESKVSLCFCNVSSPARSSRFLRLSFDTGSLDDLVLSRRSDDATDRRTFELFTLSLREYLMQSGGIILTMGSSDLSPRKTWKLLGTGTFGKVYQTTFEGRDVAVKVLPTSHVNQNELKVLRLLRRHENIIRYYGHFCGTRNGGADTFVVMEICSLDLKTLLDARPASALIRRGCDDDDENSALLKGRPPPCPYRKCWSATFYARVLLGVARGMLYMHRNGIVHRDLKPANVLFASTDSDVPKIADMGCGEKIHLISRKQHASYAVGSPVYTPHGDFAGRSGRRGDHGGVTIEYVPEKFDLYSFGIMAWEMYTRIQPYSEYANFTSSKAAVIRGAYRPPIRTDGVIQLVSSKSDPASSSWPAEVRTTARFGDGLKRILQRCWHQEPTKRGSFNDVVECLSGGERVLDGGVGWWEEDGRDKKDDACSNVVVGGKP